MNNTKETISLPELNRCLVGLEGVFEENKKKLGKLDSVIGDGDHGESMARGFATAARSIRDEEFDDAGELFKSVGRSLIKGIGGAAGPIFGSLFLGMAGEVEAKKDLTLSDLARCLSAGLDEVKSRGGAEKGDKTMVDALQPAVAGVEEVESKKDFSLCAALRQAALKAEEGMKSTKEMKSKKGRSSFASERSKGHQDPGATSIYLIVDHFYSFFCD